MNIVAPRPPKPYQTARRLREQAVRVGIDPFVAGTTPANDLAAVILAAPQLRLVLDADDPTLDVPRLGARRRTRTEQMEAEGFSPDEIASLVTYVSGQHVEHTFHADERTPWDEYVPDGAA